MGKLPPHRLHTASARRHRARMDRAAYVSPVYGDEDEEAETTALRRGRRLEDGDFDEVGSNDPADRDLFDALPTDETDDDEEDVVATGFLPLEPPQTPAMERTARPEPRPEPRPERQEMTAATYRALRAFELPSGGMVKLRRYSLLHGMRSGSLPNSLIAVARRALGDEERPGKNRESTTEEMFALVEFLTMQLVASFRVVDKDFDVPLASDEVRLAEMDDSDILAIGSFALQGQAALRSFRR